jgi:transcriptional regulator with XRE-family HTH domain
MKLNLYKLCDEKANKACIRAVLSTKQRRKLNNSIRILKKKIKFKELAEQLGISYYSLWRYLKSNSPPLLLLKIIEETTGTKFQEKIKEVEVRKARTRITREINQDLAKLIGTIIADGHLRKRNSLRGFHYELIIREEYKSNFDSLIKWFYNVFRIKLKLKKKDNHYFIYLSNKAIFNYFSLLIGIPKGKKSSIVSAPKIIKESSIEIKKAFLQGIFMFDGGVDYRTGYVNFISKSKKLIKDVNEMLNEIDLKPDYISLKPDLFKRYKIRFRKKEKLVKCIDLFEKKTEKWYRLNEHLYGLKGKTKSLKYAIKQFDKYYPKKRKNSITFTNVIKAIHKLKETDMKKVSKELKRNKTVCYEFLKKLENWQVITSKRKNLNKLWELNLVLNIPRR